MFDEKIYSERRDSLRSKIRSGIVLFLGNTYSAINYPSNAYRFRQDSNFLYYFGLDKPDLIGIIDIEGGKDTIFGDDVSMDDIIWMGEQPKIAELGAQVGVKCTRPYSDAIRELQRAIRAGRSIHYLPPYRGGQILTISDLLGIVPAKVKDYVSSELLHAVIEQRSIKQPCEVQELKDIARVGYMMQTTAMHLCRPGAHEQHMAGVLEGIACSYGYQTSFSTILSQNGQTLHNEDHSLRLTEGRLLLIDCGAESKSHYASDNTRTLPVSGRFTDVQLHVYKTVLNALNLGIEKSKPGITYLEVHRAACRTLVSGLKELGVMKGDVDEAVKQGAHALFMPHGLGHMMGLDTHDMEGLGEDNVGYDQEVERVDQFGTAALRCGRRLQKGFVITVEPGLYFIPALIDKWREEKINTNFIDFKELEKFKTFGGIRLEDDILITESGSEIIIGDARIPVEPDDVLREMEKGQ